MNNADEMKKQIAALQAKFQSKLKNVDEAQVKWCVTCAAEVERTAKTLMRDTVVNTKVSYGDHHPSMPGEAPAVESGTLRRSITHTVENAGKNKAVAYVGSILKNPPYGAYLEFGTSTIKPRPWLSTALIKCQSFMAEAKERLIGGAVK